MENDEAVVAFIAQKASIDATLREIMECSDDHFGVSSDDLNWSNVGFLTDIGKALKEIADRVLSRGEYAIQGANNAA